jgi:hypothetical protein
MQWDGTDRGVLRALVDSYAAIGVEHLLVAPQGPERGRLGESDGGGWGSGDVAAFERSEVFISYFNELVRLLNDKHGVIMRKILSRGAGRRQLRAPFHPQRWCHRVDPPTVVRLILRLRSLLTCRA